MNYFLILKLLGNILKAEAAFMGVPLIVSLIYRGNDTSAFLVTIAILLVLGFPLSFLKSKAPNRFSVKDAFVATAFSWLLFSCFGALPFYFSGASKSFIDCLFESAAGFTTTGTTLIKDTGVIDKGIMFWRRFSVWIGGVGVLIVMMAVMPSLNASSINLMRAEVTGISGEKITPKIRETAKIICFIYIAMTGLIALFLIISKMPVYDAFIHAFATAGSGGFSNMNGGPGEYGSSAVNIIITVFMFFVGVNFTLYYHLAKKNFANILKDEELRFYFGAFAAAVAVVALNVSGVLGSGGAERPFAESLGYSSFWVASVISTTGFAPLPGNIVLPALSRFVILCLMFSGCCAGSTGGGIKLVRIILLLKTARAEINKIAHPKSVKAITINGKKVDDETISKTAMFFFIYFAVFFAASLIVSVFDGKDMILTISSVISMLGNVGIGISQGGIVCDFSPFSNLSKIVYMVCMFVGRLEFFPILILLKPSMWLEKKSSEL
jgi:trk system potassium uptake protein TrkH